MPDRWCIFEEVDEVRLNGVAFNDGIIHDKAVCKFVMEDGEEYCKQQQEQLTFQLDALVLLMAMSV